MDAAAWKLAAAAGKSSFQLDVNPPTMMASSELYSSEFLELFLISLHKLDTEKSLHLVVVVVELLDAVTVSLSLAGVLDLATDTVAGVEINIVHIIDGMGFVSWTFPKSRITNL